MKKRILIIENSEPVQKILKEALEGSFEVLFTKSGREGLALVGEFHPQLVIVDQLTPHLHGIEVLKKIKALPEGPTIGVILSTWRALIQDYRIALEQGAAYYLIKPFSIATIHRIIQRYFEGKLEPAPFPLHNLNAINSIENYNPTVPSNVSYIKFWGTRGSTPVAGADYSFFGGNTPCLEISHPDTIIIIDAGTGIRELGAEVMHRRFKEVHLIIGHTHWDHILGFPFFTPAYSHQFDIHIHGPKGFGSHLEDLFKGMLDSDYFPIKLTEMQAKISFHDFNNDEPLSMGSVKISAAYACHPGATLCFKIEIADKKIGYVTDNEVMIGYHGHPKEIDINNPILVADKELIEFFKGVDLLIHEAQYLPQDYRTKVGWGHSSLSNAAVFVKNTGTKNWIITHHDPSSTDTELHMKQQLAHQIMVDCSYDCSIQLAYDNMMVYL